MRKQEAVHLHALLVEVAEHLESRMDAPGPDLAVYRELDVGPSAIHRSKDAHEDAVLVLSDAIEAGLTEQPTPGPGPP